MTRGDPGWTDADEKEWWQGMIQKVNIPPGGITQEMLKTLGKKGPYHRYINYPVDPSVIKSIDEIADELRNTPHKIKFREFL